MQERRMKSHRASATSAGVPAAGTEEGPAAEEPEEPAETMPIMAAIERERQPRSKDTTKNGGSHQLLAKVDQAPDPS